MAFLRLFSILRPSTKPRSLTRLGSHRGVFASVIHTIKCCKIYSNLYQSTSRRTGFRWEKLEDRRMLATSEGEVFSFQQTIDTSGLLGTLSGTIQWKDGTQSAAAISNAPSAGPLRIRFDYSLDANGFFSSQTRRDVLQAAGDALIQKFSDSLLAIAPGGVNQWTASFQNPATGQTQNIQNLNVAQNELVIYAGARSLPAGTLALAASGGYSASGTQSFLNTVIGRGQAGALASPPTDYGPWGGSITFSSSNTWHFGATTDGLDSTETDFLSAATHELAHLLGFGTAASWNRYVSGSLFTGPNSVANYDQGGNIPLDSGKAHWVDGTQDGGRETLMDPTTARGTRKTLTRLDLAGLQDIGWIVINPVATVSGSHTYPDNGNFSIDVTVQGSRSGSTTFTQSVTVTNAAPILQAISNKTAFAGSVLSISKLGQFTDLGFDNSAATPATQERFTFQVDWGDGTTPQSGSATIQTTGSPGTPTSGFFDASHTYANPGNYNAKARITDDDGGFMERTFTVNVQVPPRLELILSKNSFAENSGAAAASLTVRRVGGDGAALVVQLASNDTSEAQVPTSVTIAAGSNETTVGVTAVDDTLLDGPQTVTLNAQASGYSSTSTNLTVSDFETLTGTLSDSSIAENLGAGVVTWRVFRSNTDNASPLTIQLTSSDPSEITVPASAVILGGQDSVLVGVTVVDDAVLDGTISVLLTATATGYQTGSNSINVLDHETILVSLERTELSEGGTATTGNLSLSFPAPAGGFTALLSATPTNQANFPSQVVFAAGQSNMSFPISAVDDYAVEGTQNLRLFANGQGIIGAAVDFVITDNDLPLWQNPVNPFDCDDNDFVNAIDALLIINRLNRTGSRYFIPGVDPEAPPYLDTNGDGLLNAIDALVVINELNRQ
jgi:hypothetical protein